MNEPANSTVDELLQLFRSRGDSLYGGEAVTQVEHALQAAALAEHQQASPELISAALLHDIGHLLHELPDDAPDEGVDDLHQETGFQYLRERFSVAVVEPVRLHVAAKRFLCAVDIGYQENLSRPSLVSLKLQGGPMSVEEQARFRFRRYWREAVILRRWDDAAKVTDYPTPALEHFVRYLNQSLLRGGEA